MHPVSTSSRIISASASPGGKIIKDEDLAPRIEATDDVYHEHCYHMFLSWYHNFWRVMDDIGLERHRNFTPRDNLVHLFPGTTPVKERCRTLREYGSFESLADNLLSGVAPVPDVLLWLYSTADLVGQAFNPARFLDIVSVHGFMSSRWYGTGQSAELHQHMLAKAFAVPSYFTSAAAYRDFLAYSMKEPHPLLWVLNDNSQEGLFLPFERRLRALGCQIETGARVTKLVRDDNDGRVIGINWEPSGDYDPDEPDARARRSEKGKPEEKGKASKQGEPDERFDYVILAVPPATLAELVDPFRDKVPGLSTVRKLKSGVTAALDLYFKEPILGLPKDHMVLRDSRYGLTFIDNGQAWSGDSGLQPDGGERKTHLSVAATDFYIIDGMSKEEATNAIITDLRRYIPFEYTDIDWGRVYLDMNQTDPLFVNEVGSELWRPDAVTEIPNLFLAGDFCDHPIGIVTVEGAVVSGLQAVCALQARVRVDQRSRVRAGDPLLRPIDIVQPDTHPGVNPKGLKLMLMPYAAAAKAWSRAEEFARSPARALSPREINAMAADLLSAPGAFAADWWSFAADAVRWMGDIAYSDDHARD